MISAAAQAVIVLAALFLAWLAGTALLAPARAERFLLGFASTALKHGVELAIRLLVGGALVIAAPKMALQGAFLAFGWTLVASTLVLSVLPWRLHRRFAQFAVPIALKYLPAIGLVALAGAAALIGSLFRGAAA